MAEVYFEDPFTRTFTRPSEMCRKEYAGPELATRGVYHTYLLQDRAFTAKCPPPYHNDSTQIYFGMRLAEVPASKAIKSAMWALSKDGPCASEDAVGSTTCHHGEQVGEFASIGHAKRLAQGENEKIFDVLAAELSLEAGPYYVNCYICDMLNNCAMRSSVYPVTVDGTPPELPHTVVADRFVVTSADGERHFFVNQSRIGAMWIFPGFSAARSVAGAIPVDDPSLVLKDKESFVKFAYADLYRLYPESASGKVWRWAAPPWR